MSTVVLTAPAGVRRAILPSGIYDVGAAGTISIPSADLMEALEAGFLYSVNVGGSIYRGDLACAGNPEYPAGLVGDQYCVLTAGRVGGGSGPLVQVNDFVVCILDNVGGTHAAVGANWKILQANISKSVEGPASTVTASSLAGFDGTTGALIKEITALPNNTTATTLLATTVDTNVAAAGVTLAGTTLSADGTDADISITITPKGTGSVVVSKIDINGGSIDAVTIGGAVPAPASVTTLVVGGVEVYWAPALGTLQALIDSIIDATSNRVYTIIVPPGQGGALEVAGALVLKPFVNIQGAGGKDLMTVMSFTGGISIGSGQLISGNNRITISGIRLNNTVVTIENLVGTNTLTVHFRDMYMPSHSYVRVCGASYALRAKTNVHFFDSWHQNNSQAQSSFIYCKFYAWGGEMHIFNYVDSDAVFNGTRLKSDQMADVTSTNYKAIAAGAGLSCSLIYHNCGEERYTPETGVSLYHHLMANWAGNTNTAQVNGMIKGSGVPAGDVGLEGSLCYEKLTSYADGATGKLHIKTAASGTDTWVVVGAQTA